MCGIVGGVSSRNIVPVLVQGLLLTITQSGETADTLVTSAMPVVTVE